MFFTERDLIDKSISSQQVNIDHTVIHIFKNFTPNFMVVARWAIELKA